MALYFGYFRHWKFCSLVLWKFFLETRNVHMLNLLFILALANASEKLSSFPLVDSARWNSKLFHGFGKFVPTWFLLLMESLGKLQQALWILVKLFWKFLRILSTLLHTCNSYGLVYSKFSPTLGYFLRSKNISMILIKSNSSIKSIWPFNPLIFQYLTFKSM